MAKQKFYVVWDGAEDGVYTTWEACQEAVKGYSNAKYKSFKSEEEAEEAFELGYEEWKKRNETNSSSQSPNLPKGREDQQQSISDGSLSFEGDRQSPKRDWGDSVDLNSVAVDAACSGNPGQMEYRGVYLKTGKEIFHFGPVFGTNNIGEFLAIVHGLALLKQKGLNDMIIYSDSVNAQNWVRKKQCRTTLERNKNTEQLFQMIDRAVMWLHNNTWQNRIIKWQTDVWGEIPADFGRK